ncbi:MAG: hypothetical protein IJF04_06475 [Oscillospiraceae bacterium]|nr:hypothetical protein [Oscillospiraceae bacterium]
MDFTVLKTGVTVSPLFFAVLTAFLLLDKNGVAIWAVLFSLMHESGHFLALLCVKSRPKHIKLSAFGIEMRLCNNLSTLKKVIVFSSGFGLNFIAALLLFIFEKDFLSTVNIAIGVFTALPLASTDGGAVLSVLIEETFAENAEKIIKITFAFFAVLIFAVLLILFGFSKNYFLLIAALYAVICLKKELC